MTYRIMLIFFSIFFLIGCSPSVSTTKIPKQEKDQLIGKIEEHTIETVLDKENNITLDKSTGKPATGLKKIVIKLKYGNLISLIPYKNGKKEGLEKFYNFNGNLTYLIPYKNDIKEGLARWYYDDGNIKSEVSYKNDKIEGLEKFYYENSILESQVAYKDGKRFGVGKFYYDNGILEREVPFENDKKEGIERRYLENGILGFEIPFKNGLPATTYNNSDEKKSFSNSTTILAGLSAVHVGKGGSAGASEGLLAATLLLDFFDNESKTNKAKNKADIFECNVLNRTGDVEDYSDKIKVRLTPSFAYFEMDKEGKEYSRPAVKNGYDGISVKLDEFIIHDYSFSISKRERKVLGATTYQCRLSSK